MPSKKQQKYTTSHILDFSAFFSSEVIAFVSDRTIDFARKGNALHLTQKQQIFLSRAAGVKIHKLPHIKQIHGRRIIVIKRPSCFGVKHPLKADGLMTQKSGIPLSVRTADCLSIFMFDPKNNAIALVHAGWRGAQKKIAGRAVHLMKKHFGTNPKNLKVAFGPSIRKCCYEVGKEFRKYFPKEIIKKGEHLHLDLPLANKRQLIKAKVKAKNIYDPKICTCCNRHFFSYRRDKEKAGRMISLMMLNPVRKFFSNGVK